MGNQSHLPERFADVISELPPSAVGGMVTATNSLQLCAGEWPLFAVLESASASAPKYYNNQVMQSGQKNFLMK